jgi:mono/diheme cytochrome c family protein
MNRASIPTAIIAVVLVGIPVGAASAGSLHGSSSNTAAKAVATPNGKKVFTGLAGCTGCHTMKAARSTGTVGPNLDRVKPSRARVIKIVTNGKGAMPSFKRVLTKAEIAAVATYIANNT